MKHLSSLAVILVALGATGSHASPIQVTATPSTVTAGQPVGVTVGGVVDPADGIGAFTFALSFNPTISYVAGSFSLGSILTGWLPFVSAGPGSVNISIADYPTDITAPDSGGASVPLFSLQLATSVSTPARPQLITASPDRNDAGVPGAYQFSTTSGSVSVTPAVQSVPAPGELAMVPALLLALAAPRRRA